MNQQHIAPDNPYSISHPPAMPPFKILIEKHADGYVVYPVGMKGIIVGEGDTYDEAVADVTSAIRFHIKTFGKDVFSDDDIEDARMIEVVI